MLELITIFALGFLTSYLLDHKDKVKVLHDKLDEVLAHLKSK